MKKYTKTFIHDGNEKSFICNDITKECKDLLEKLQLLGKENDFTLHCEESILSELTEILNNIFKI